eukprot:TRINITY_DN6310_c0_g1_i1.p2 TRINITY_DN6310_c0_g1~~TRINITY_DN6310_c0_g1_i1.p2  ORF type:complete len:106 (+),score=45.11 TRINITY_DN6310_c0_g1_i1:298-615(+)
MAPFPRMKFPQDWHTYDVQNGAVIFQLQNEFPPPADPATGQMFKFPNITRLVYGGNMLWKEEQDWYNPAKDAPRVTRAWRKAGGRFESKEVLKMKHRGKDLPAKL